MLLRVVPVCLLVDDEHLAAVLRQTLSRSPVGQIEFSLAHLNQFYTLGEGRLLAPVSYL